MKFGHAAVLFGLILLAPSPAAAHDASPLSVVEARFKGVAHHDVEAIAALYADDAVESSPGFCTVRRGQEGARRTYGDLFKAAPNIEDEVTAYVVDGKHVAVQFIARVRKPDGSVAFEASLANFLTVEHGRITRDETYFDPRGQPCA